MTELSSEQRRQVTLVQEGVVLEQVGRSGPSLVGEITRAQVDGMMNGLIRLEGVEAAAEFAFRVSDRVAGGVREPTEPLFRLMPPAMPVPAPAAAAVTVHAGEGHWWAAWAWGLLHGALIAFLAIGAFR